MSRPNNMRRAEIGAVPSGPVLDLDSHIPTKVAILANRLSRSASRFYRKRYGIGVVEWRLVMYLGQVPETRANRICSETDLDKGAVSRSLGVLQRMGIVSAEEDGSDSRRNNVTLTAKGRTLYDDMVPIALDRQSELLADLTPAEIDKFSELIDRLQTRIADGDPLLDEAPPKRAPPARSLKRTSRRAKASNRREG